MPLSLCISQAAVRQQWSRDSTDQRKGGGRFKKSQLGKGQLSKTYGYLSKLSSSCLLSLGRLHSFRASPIPPVLLFPYKQELCGMGGVRLSGCGVLGPRGKREQNTDVEHFGCLRNVTAVLSPLEDYVIFTVSVPGVWPLPTLSHAAQAGGNARWERDLVWWLDKCSIPLKWRSEGLVGMYFTSGNEIKFVRCLFFSCLFHHC